MYMPAEHCLASCFLIGIGGKSVSVAVCCIGMCGYIILWRALITWWPDWLIDIMRKWPHVPDWLISCRHLIRRLFHNKWWMVSVIAIRGLSLVDSFMSCWRLSCTLLTSLMHSVDVLDAVCCWRVGFTWCSMLNAQCLETETPSLVLDSYVRL